MPKRAAPAAGRPELITLHGVFMQVHGVGVLLSGGSGVGKSELALELLTRGHQLIADDAAEFAARGKFLLGRCPPLLAGFLEARSLGILNVRRLFGRRAVARNHWLHLVVHLEMRSERIAVPPALERLHGRRGTRRILDIDVPEISIPIRLGHNLAVLVEAACRDYKLRRRGYRADDDLAARQLKAIADTKP
ncbi:MAG TPA: hypothetical protein VHE37_06220 [Nevskiaceae bacterium]|nr:hypothetical protein [Nevskiaceae bacterium]